MSLYAIDFVIGDHVIGRLQQEVPITILLHQSCRDRDKIYIDYNFVIFVMKTETWVLFASFLLVKYKHRLRLLSCEKKHYFDMMEIYKLSICGWCHISSHWVQFRVILHTYPSQYSPIKSFHPIYVIYMPVGEPNKPLLFYSMEKKTQRIRTTGHKYQCHFV